MLICNSCKRRSHVENITGRGACHENLFNRLFSLRPGSCGKVNILGYQHLTRVRQTDGLAEITVTCSRDKAHAAARCRSDIYSAAMETVQSSAGGQGSLQRTDRRVSRQKGRVGWMDGGRTDDRERMARKSVTSGGKVWPMHCKRWPNKEKREREESEPGCRSHHVLALCRVADR